MNAYLDGLTEDGLKLKLLSGDLRYIAEISRKYPLMRREIELLRKEHAAVGWHQAVLHNGTFSGYSDAAEAMQAVYDAYEAEFGEKRDGNA